MDTDSCQGPTDHPIRLLRLCGLILSLGAFPACVDSGGTGCGPNPQFGLFCCPTCPEFVPKTCNELTASELFWTLSGFSAGDILNPDVRNQTELTAVLHVGDSKSLKVSAGSTATSEDCSQKAVAVDWSVSNPAAVRIDIAADSHGASLLALEPGDTVVSAVLQFEDGTPPMRVFPWSFTNVGSGDITNIRVVP
jgi:hypothetical protein